MPGAIRPGQESNQVLRRSLDRPTRFDRSSLNYISHTDTGAHTPDLPAGLAMVRHWQAAKGCPRSLAVGGSRLVRCPRDPRAFTSVRIDRPAGQPDICICFPETEHARRARHAGGRHSGRLAVEMRGPPSNAFTVHRVPGSRRPPASRTAAQHPEPSRTATTTTRGATIEPLVRRPAGKGGGPG